MQATSPSRPSLRTIQKETTRARILATARQLFRDSGIAGVSMDDIASAAEVGRATIYLHYSGKPALLVDLLNEDWERQARLFERLAAEKTIDRAVMSAWLNKVVRGVQGAKDSFVLHRFALSLDDNVGVSHQAHRTRLASILTRRFTAFSDDPVRLKIEGALMVAQLEHLGIASAISWDARETQLAVELLTEALLPLMAPLS